jgi:hypothetical protein
MPRKPQNFLPESKSSSTGELRKRETAEDQKPVLPRSPSPLCPLVTSFLTFQTLVAQGFQDSVNNL